MSDDRNSESSDEEIVPSRKFSKSKAVIDSDDENEHEEKKHIENHNETSTDNNIADPVVTKTILSKYKALIDSDSSSEDEVEKPEPTTKKNNSASSSDDSDICGNSGDDDIVIPKDNTEPKTQRKSAAECVEVMKEKMNYKNAEKLKQIIQSEKQRMERDADISVPYHRPKQHTLKEFLARKTAITSSLTLERFKNMKNPMKAIKVSVDDLQLIIEKTKKRQEESEEFFSNCISDEEENDDADLKLNDHSSATDIDKIVDPTKEVSLTNEILETEEVTETEEVARIEVPTKENVCPTKEASSTESLMEVQPAETPANAEPKDILNTILDDIESIESKESSSAEADLPTHSKDDPIFKNVLSQTSTETNIQESIAEPLSTVNTNPPSNENAVVSMETNEPIQPIEDPELAILRSKYLGPDQIEEPTPKVENASTSQNFPSLQGKDNEDMIIDLETGVVKPRQLTGAEFFRKCFTSYLKKTPGLQLPVPQSTFENFKKKLVEKMQQKRIEALGKKKKDETEAQAKVDAEAEEAKKTKEGFENDAACGSEEENVDDEEEEETDEESIPEKIVYKTVDVNRFLVTDCGGDVDPNDEALFETDSDNDEASSSSSSEEETENVDDIKQRKSRILKAFVDSDDEGSKSCATPTVDATKQLEKADDKNTEELVFSEDYVHVVFAKPTKAPLSFDDIFASQNTAPSNFSEPSYSEEIPSELKSLCDPAVSQNQDEDLLDICSGQFAATQATDALFTQRDNIPPSTQDDNELLLLCSGQFETQANEVKDQSTESQNVISSPIKKGRHILSSSEDEDESLEEAVTTIKLKKRKKKVKKQKRNLWYGVARNIESEDDEEANENTEQNTEEIIEKIREKNRILSSEYSEDGVIAKIAKPVEKSAKDEEEETYIDYDSEENEVEVKLNRQQRRKAATEYLENEADLSGSEWGSADEDEKEMDKLMVEMGDEEQFDQDQLREEVGRIHMRKMLDDDLKNVKKITNLLFDNEENDGAERERKFRWKNNTEGFNVEDENARDANEAVRDGEDLDDDSETLWRKIRHERETILAEQSQKAAENNENLNEDVLLLDHGSQTVSNAANTSLTKRKFQIIKMNNNVEKESKKDSPFLISKSRASSASFLARDVTTLNKLAHFTKNATDDVSNVGSGSGRGNQFVFTTLSPSVVESKKRGLEENENNNPNNKKPKLIEKSSRKKLMMLDQLN